MLGERKKKKEEGDIRDGVIRVSHVAISGGKKEERGLAIGAVGRRICL